MAEKTLMPSPHAEGAKALLDKIRALRAEIPRLAPAGPIDGRKTGARSLVSDMFLEAVSVLLEAFPRIAKAVGIDATALRDSYGFAMSYEPVVQELRTLTRLVWYSIRLERAEAVQNALDIYAFVQRQSEKKDGAELLPYVEDMRQKLLRNRTRKTNSNPVPAPEVTAAPSAKV